jgi:site-specific recombinase XerD
LLISNDLRLIFTSTLFLAVPITFHTARHTFATMMLTLGADLYTVSKLLGHTSVKMTQVYAKIVNKKKDDAVNLTNGLFD